MKILLPTETNHTIKLEPRYYPLGELSMIITKEGYNTTQEVTPTYVNNYGVVDLTFDLVGEEQDRFSITVTENDEIVYRGNLFFTSQTPQDFKLTKDTYIYV